MFATADITEIWGSSRELFLFLDIRLPSQYKQLLLSTMYRMYVPT